MKKQSISFSQTCFLKNGKPFYLNSGEFHYFRVPHTDWKRRLKLFKETGGNCVATYVPWLIHEPTEGRFTFSHKNGHLNIEAFLETVASVGLDVIVRPGPFQYTEFIFDGVAKWLYSKYPEIRAVNIQGQPLAPDVASYLHPLFLEKTRAWFEKVCPLLARYSVNRGGPITFAQFDNELCGIHVWKGSLDYNPVTYGLGKTTGRYVQYLVAKYVDLKSLNSAYGTKYKSFAEVRPVVSPKNLCELRNVQDYFDFYLQCTADYAKILADWMRELGLDMPLVHNSPAPYMNAFFDKMVKVLGDDFLLGTDHYYCLNQNWEQNNPTPQYAVRCFHSLEQLRLHKRPATVFELPGGSCSDWPPVEAKDAEVCYLTNLALGMKAHNYYIFTGGPNPPGAGCFSDGYDFSAAISHDGKLRDLYHTQKKFGRFLAANPWIAEAEQDNDVNIIFDNDHSRAEHYWPASLTQFSGTEAMVFLKKGILTSLFCGSFSPKFMNIEDENWVLATDKPAFIVTSAMMSRKKQERVIAFLKNGGRALIAPVLPALDENFNPCTSLADFLGATPCQQLKEPYVRLSFDKLKNVGRTGKVFAWDKLPAKASRIGHDELTGKCFAWAKKTAGQGQAIVLGKQWLHTMNEHHQMLSLLLNQLKVVPLIRSTNPNVWCVLRTVNKRSLLFVMNLFVSPMDVRLRINPDWTNRTLDSGPLKVPGMSVSVFEVVSGKKPKKIYQTV